VVESKPLLLASASLIGIFLISFASSWIELEFTDLNEINSNMLNEVVHVRGVVKEFKEFSVGVRALIEQNDFRINVVYFKKIKGKKEMCADIIGEIKTNEGSVEISASSLTLFIC